MFKTIFQWFIYSSKNPQNIALTIKGLIPFLVLLGVDSQMADSAADTVVELVTLGATILTGVVTAWGLLRKLYITFVKKEY